MHTSDLCVTLPGTAPPEGPGCSPVRCHSAVRPWRFSSLLVPVLCEVRAGGHRATVRRDVQLGLRLHQAVDVAFCACVRLKPCI